LKPSPNIMKSKLKVLYDHRESFEGKRRSKSSCIHSDGRRSRQQDARALEVCASALSCYSKQNPDNFLDRPVILEEDEGDTFAHTTDFEATLPPSTLSLFPPLRGVSALIRRESWWDVEEGGFVYEDLHPPPSLDHADSAFTPAQDWPPSRRHSLGVSQEQTKPHGDSRTTRSASEESDAEIITLDQDGAGRVKKTSQILKGTCNWPSKSKRSY